MIEQEAAYVVVQFYPYNDLYGKAPPKRSTFFRLQLYESLGISLVEVYETAGKFIICSQMHFMAVKTLRKLLFVLYLKDGAFTAVRRNAKF